MLFIFHEMYVDNPHAVVESEYNYKQCCNDEEGNFIISKQLLKIFPFKRNKWNKFNKIGKEIMLRKKMFLFWRFFACSLEIWSGNNKT